jgi:hypothetical protein
MAQLPGVPSDDLGVWIKTTCMAALSSFVRLQNRFFGRLSFLLPDLLKLLENCITQGGAPPPRRPRSG